jgi:glycosyltransferase involved in cell wall biosynthesis
VPVRCAIVPPVPVPYREPLFSALARRARVDPRIIYLSAHQPGWDMRASWFGGSDGSYPHEILHARQRSRTGRSPILLPSGLGGALDRARPRCVVSWEFGPATWRALAWCRRRHLPLVVFSELTPWSDRELSPAQLRIHRTLAPRLDGFIVASSQGRERLTAMGVEPARVEVALQSADLEPFLAVRPAVASEGPVRVLFVGRLVADKNLGTLISAFRAGGFAEDEAELVLAGAGPLEEELRSAAAGAAVRFTGYVAPEELPGIYAGAGVLALVSSYEPFGVTMREGAAAGLPLLCSRRAGAAGDVAVDGENAVIVDPDDAGAITRALQGLVRDHELRARFAEGSRAVTARHPPEDDTRAWERAVLRPAGAEPEQPHAPPSAGPPRA